MNNLKTRQNILTTLYKFQEKYFKVAHIDVTEKTNCIFVWVSKANRKKLFVFNMNSPYSKKTRIWKYRELISYINKLNEAQNEVS